MATVINHITKTLYSALRSPAFWVIAAIVAAVIGMLYIYRELKLRALETVEYERSFSTDGVFMGETLELTETVKNPGLFPLFAVRIDFFVPSGLTIDGVVCNEYKKLTSIFTLPPFSKVKKVHTVKSDRRDHFKLYSADIVYRKYEYKFDTPIEFYSYPNRFDAGTDLTPDVYHAGNAISSKKYIEDPFFISGIRPYRMGDPLRSINFKASARSFSSGVRQFMCNEYDTSRNYDSMIFLDVSDYAGSCTDGKTLIETGLRYACFLFCEAVKNGGSVGFSSNCSSENDSYIHIPCGNGDMHTKMILEKFADISPFAKRNYSMAAILKKYALTIPKGADIYMITPHIDANTADIISSLRRMGRNVQIIPLMKGEEKKCS